MRRPATLLIAMTWLAVAAARAGEPGVVDSSYTLPDGGRVLELSTVVPGAPGDVWDAMTTTEGFRSWAVPVARIDARVGGEIESSYDRKAQIGDPGNIRNEILVLIPRRLLVIRNVQAPPRTPFDVPAFQKTQTALWFEAVDATHTRVTLANGTYGQGEPWDGVYRHFKAGNAYTLEKLRERFEKGPTDWTPAPASPAAR